MRYFKLDKLVRDLIVDQIKVDGRETFGVRKLSNKDFIQELQKKLLEETQELLEAADREEQIKELTDIQEIIDYLKKSLNITNEEINKAQQKKLKVVGGFKEQLYIDVVGIDEDDKWLQKYIDNPRAIEVEKPIINKV